MFTQCLTCRRPIAQRERGRRRKFCSDACRYAEIARRKAERPAPAKPYQCAICGGPIEQPKTGSRQSCAACSVPRKPVQKATAAL